MDYMVIVQRDITPHMRGILVDWLVEVAEEYKLVPDTLHLAVSYIDRFLSFNDINRTKLQLLGVSSMLIASWVLVMFFVFCLMFYLLQHCDWFFDLYRKHEEISPPYVEEFCFITDNSYNKDEVNIYTIPCFFCCKIVKLQCGETQMVNVWIIWLGVLSLAARYENHMWGEIFRFKASQLLWGISFFLVVCEYTLICVNAHSLCYSYFLLSFQVLEMEADILKTLEFDTANPTVKTFLRQEIVKSVCYSVL